MVRVGVVCLERKELGDVPLLGRSPLQVDPPVVGRGPEDRPPVLPVVRAAVEDVDLEPRVVVVATGRRLVRSFRWKASSSWGQLGTGRGKLLGGHVLRPHLDGRAAGVPLLQHLPLQGLANIAHEPKPLQSPSALTASAAASHTASPYPTREYFPELKMSLSPASTSPWMVPPTFFSLPSSRAALTIRYSESPPTIQSLMVKVRSLETKSRSFPATALYLSLPLPRNMMVKIPLTAARMDLLFP
eukprot:Sspe_Gene.795::Locus_263_Transcript_1_1_Confidence_1.000_Length_1931::g.795::m.795